MNETDEKKAAQAVEEIAQEQEALKAKPMEQNSPKKIQNQLSCQTI